MTTFCLLIFARNDNADVSRLVNSLKEDVDEIVIIDSSDTSVYESLVKELGGMARVYRAVPMGITDPFRAYASANIASDYVINLDCDEEMTDDLKRDFRELDKEAAYIVGWYHVELNEQAKKLIIYKNGALQWIGHVFESPTVTGRTVDFSNRYRILHHAKMNVDYLRQGNRRDRYFFLESLQRPPTWEMILRSLHRNPVRSRALRLLHKIPPEPIWKFIIVATYLRRLIGQWGTRRISRHLFHYGLERISYFSSLNPEQRRLYSKICEDIYSNGGLVSYLSFQDPECMETLNSTYDWQDSGNAVRVPKMLIMYRHLTGKSLRSFRDFPYTKEQFEEFWGEGRQPRAQDTD